MRMHRNGVAHFVSSVEPCGSHGASPPTDDSRPGDELHSSLRWFVQVRMYYADFNSHMTERVRRPIVMVNAP
jgi:hypothetical protein